VQVPLRGRRFVLHTYLPAEVRPGSPLVLYASGAGGWHSFDGHVAEVLAGAGMPVCGLSTHSYLEDFYGDSHPATPEEVGADFAALVEQARAAASVDANRPVALVGWSLGAGYVLPAASDARIKPYAYGVVGIAVSRENETVYSLRHELMSLVTNKTYGPDFDAAQYLKASAPIPVALIQSEGDRGASPGEARGLMAAAGRGQDAGVRLYVVGGARNHRFGGRVAEFDRTLLAAFEWMAAMRRSAGAS
jgi:dienelactone hydrolase